MNISLSPSTDPPPIPLSTFLIPNCLHSSNVNETYTAPSEVDTRRRMSQLKRFSVLNNENEENEVPHAPYLPATSTLPQSTSTLPQSTSTLAAESNAWFDFPVERESLISKAKAVTTSTTHNERQHVKFGIKYLNSFSKLPPTLEELLPNTLENETIDLSMQSNKPLGLTNPSDLRPNVRLIKRPADVEIAKPLSKIFKDTRARENHALNMPENLPKKCQMFHTPLGPIPPLICTLKRNSQAAASAISPRGNTNNKTGGTVEIPTVTSLEIPSSSSDIFFESEEHRINEDEATLQKSTKKVLSNMSDKIKKLIDENAVVWNNIEMVVLGSNGTTINKDLLYDIDWSISGSAVTRKILAALFDQEILATHTLSGKPSPAFLDLNMPEKGRLDPGVVSDIIQFMALTKNMESTDVRHTITMKCADESKSLRRQRGKRKERDEQNKE